LKAGPHHVKDGQVMSPLSKRFGIKPPAAAYIKNPAFFGKMPFKKTYK
jgi:hypothetical protein